MAHYLDPKNDMTFKRVFGEHKHLCKSLLNNILPLENPVVEIEYQTGELIPELAKILRNTVVDVRCTDAIGRQFIVEMQLYWSDSFKSRVVLNASKAYLKQLDKTEDFRLLQPVFALNFVNDTFENSSEMKDEYLHHYKIVNIKHTDKRIDDLEFLFVELPKFKAQNRAEQKLHNLWMLFLTRVNEKTDEIPPELLENELTREAVGYMERAAYSKAQLEAYDKFKDVIMTEKSIIGDAMKKGRDEGRDEGREEGLKEGREEGLKEGREEGREDGRKEKNVETVINSNRVGLPVETISIITGLTVEEVMKIIANYC